MRRGVSLATLALLVTQCAATFSSGTFSSGSLVVNNPPSLADQFRNHEIEQSPALFGLPAEGGHEAQLTGRAIYVPQDDIEGCWPINKTELPKMAENEVFIMVIERGDCTFVSKVKHAQDVGASACVVVDNRTEIYLPVMADDGRGSMVVIPSMLIRKYSGDKIAAAARDGMVTLTMKWNIPHPDNIVEWQMWTTSDDTTAVDFKRDFDVVAGVLGDSATFTPNYLFDPGWWWGCNRSNLPCGDMCTNGGRYCMKNTKSNKTTGLSSTTAMAENLRQICLFKTLVNQTARWWNYVEIFDKDCFTDFSKGCAERSMANELVNADIDAVNACMEDSGGVGPTKGNNILLEHELTKRSEQGVSIRPTIVINNALYHGSLSCFPPIDRSTCGVLNTMCWGFKDPSVIPACNTAPGCSLGQVKDQCGKCGGNGEYDACGECLDVNSQAFNASCKGCDGVVNSHVERDECLQCGGQGRDACGKCRVNGTSDADWVADPALCAAEAAAAAGTSDNVISPVIAAVIGGVVLLLVGLAAFAYVRYRQRLFKDDVDALLAQYLPMADGVGQVNKGGAVQTDVNVHTS